MNENPMIRRVRTRSELLEEIEEDFEAWNGLVFDPTQTREEAIEEYFQYLLNLHQ